MATPIHPAAAPAIRVLVWGFRFAATAIVLGTVISLIRQEPLADRLPPTGDVLDSVTNLEGTGFFGAGIYAIILTPVIATLAIAIAFAQARDRRYATWAGAVLAILAISILWSAR